MYVCVRFLVFFAETESLYTKVTQGILDRFGKKFEWNLKSQIMGRPPLVGAKVVVDTLQIPLEPETFLDELHAELDKIFPEAELMPGKVVVGGQPNTHIHKHTCARIHMYTHRHKHTHIDICIDMHTHDMYTHRHMYRHAHT